MASKSAADAMTSLTELEDGERGCIINTAGFLRGMEQVFVDLATDEPAGLLLIDRFLDIQFEVARRTLELAPT